MDYSDENAIDNLLVSQKNRILWLINNDFLSEARAALDVVAPLWLACNYSYKTHEVEARISEAIRLTTVSA